jgi:hypothetical protein
MSNSNSPTTPVSATHRRLSGFQTAISDSVAQLLTPCQAPNVTTTRESIGAPLTLDPEDESGPQDDAPHSSSKTITIGGQTLTLSATPGDTTNLNIGKLYDKTKRHELTPDQLTDFVTFATKNILRKRLNQVSVSATDDNALEHLSFLQNQLTSLRDHLHTSDMDDVFDIVYPIDSHTSPDLHPGDPINLFTAYVSLDPAMVANHTVFCHTWLGAAPPYVVQNFNFTYTFLKNNTEDSLWAKCLVEYEKYPPAARGGPLMLSIILTRIVQTTQTALDFLVLKLTHLKISTIEGENVETVATMVEAVIQLLNQAALSEKARLPSDFPKTLLKLYQTTSVPSFNDIFMRHYQDALEQQDLHGGNACWPDPAKINKLVTAAYRNPMTVNLIS